MKTNGLALGGGLCLTFRHLTRPLRRPRNKYFIGVPNYDFTPPFLLLLVPNEQVADRMRVFTELLIKVAEEIRR